MPHLTPVPSNSDLWRAYAIAPAVTPLTTVWMSAIMVPPVVLAGTAFWLLVKNPMLIGGVTKGQH